MAAGTYSIYKHRDATELTSRFDPLHRPTEEHKR